MSSLLHIQVSPSGSYSVSRGVSEEFVSAWKASHAGGKIIDRDLTKEQIPHLDSEAIAANHTPADQHSPAMKDKFAYRGFYIWVTLPPEIDTNALVPKAIAAKVAYVPGTAFYADGFGSWSLRISFCHPTPERITDGIKSLAGVIKTEMESRQIN